MSDGEDASLPKLRSLPVLLNANPEDSQAEIEFEKWELMAKRYIRNLPPSYLQEDKLAILSTGLSASNFLIVKRAKSSEEAFTALKNAFVKKHNLLVTRETLHSARQLQGEDIKTFYRRCLTLSQDCEFQAVSAEENVAQNARDAFVVGLRNSSVKARVMEKGLQTLEETLNTALTVDDAIRDSALTAPISAPVIQDELTPQIIQPVASALSRRTQNPFPQGGSNSSYFRPPASRFPRCGKCSQTRHAVGIRCPAQGATCNYCRKIGHFKAVCNLRLRHEQQRSLSSLAKEEPCTQENLYSEEPLGMHCQNKASRAGEIALFGGLDMSTLSVLINGFCTTALVDSGSFCNVINESFYHKINCKGDFSLNKSRMIITRMAHADSKVALDSYVCCDIFINKTCYKNVCLMLMPSAVYDIILGEPFFKRHTSVTFSSNGNSPSFQIGLLSSIEAINPVSPFANLDTNITPIAVKSRRYSEWDLEFVRGEVGKLLANNIISPSSSPWRAQVLVANREVKPRLVIDYSQTINRYTYPDAYPIPNIESLVNTIALNKFYSKIDLTSAYHQIPLDKKYRKFTAFEACGKLYEFNRLCFGLTNGSACFQRVMDDLVHKHGLQKCFPFMDDITIAGSTKQEHDQNLFAFRKMVELHNLTLNESKCSYGQTSIKLLGYEISHNLVRPDPDRLQGLKSYRLPSTSKELERLKGMLAYYAKWIKNYSDKIGLLSHADLPLDMAVRSRITELIEELGNVTLRRIDPGIPFTVETDASYHAIAATLSQNSHPVAFFSRTLSSSERNHSSVEKEAYAIVESIRRWSHLLLGTVFTIVTDQKSVSFMFDEKHSSNVKNDKIARWRIELLPYKYKIIYRSGAQNIPADALTRNKSRTSFRKTRPRRRDRKVKHVNAIVSPCNLLIKAHSSYGHPGVTRMWELVGRLKLAVSIDEVRKVCRECSVCSQLKPSFKKTAPETLISAVKPMDRISIDFKGPLPNSSFNNRFLFVAIDEYSRYPFAFPCKNINADTVISCLRKVFSLCGPAGYVHSDRGTSFMSNMVKDFLFAKGIASSHSTPYHPTGNSQCEKYVGVIWKTVNLNLKDRRMEVTKWDSVLDDSLCNIRSLINTSTNCTPHDRFFSFRRGVFIQTNDACEVNRQKYMYLRKFVRGKTDPLVEQVEVLNHNPKFSEIKYGDGKIDKVSNNDLSRCPLPKIDSDVELSSTNDPGRVDNPDLLPASPSEHAPATSPGVSDTCNPPPSSIMPEADSPNLQSSSSSQGVRSNSEAFSTPVQVRRSVRESKPPERYRSVDFRK